MPRQTTELLSRTEAAETLSVCLRSIDNYVRDGHLRPVRRPLAGRRMGTFIPVTEIERFRREVAVRAKGKAR